MRPHLPIIVPLRHPPIIAPNRPRPGLRGLGDAALLNAAGVSGKGGASGAVTGAAKGAAVGSALVPGIGTAIGAVIGAIAGGLIHTSQYPQWLAEDTNIIQVLRQLPSGFQGRTLPRQTPTPTNPLTLAMIWSAIVVTGHMYSYVNPDPAHSPSDMQHEFDWVMGWIGTIIQAMNKTPVGQPVSLSIPVGNGVTFSLAFINPGSASSATVAQKVIIPAYIAWCTHNNAVDVSNCNKDASDPINQLVLTLMTDYQIGQYPPPASQTPAAPAKATTQPIVTPAKTATVTVSSPAATTTVVAGNATTTPTQPTQYWLTSTGQFGSGTTLPSGAIPLTQAQYTLMTTQPNSAAAQALYDSLMGFSAAPAASSNATAPIQTTAPTIINVPAQQAAAAAAPLESGVPTWVYLLGGAIAVYAISRKK